MFQSSLPGEVAERVSNSGGPVGSLQPPHRVGIIPLALHLDGEVASLRGEHMLGLRVVWQDFSRSSCQQNRSAPGLGNTILASLKDSKGALVSHLHQCSHAQLEYHGLLVRGKVADIFQDEEPWPELQNRLINILALLQVQTCSTRSRKGRSTRGSS